MSISACSESKQVVVALLRSHALRITMHDDLAVEDAAACSADDAAKRRITARLRGDVVHSRMVIDVLSRREENAEQPDARPGLEQAHIDIVACEAAAEIHVADLQGGPCAQLGECKRRVQLPPAVLLQAVENERRIGALVDLHDGIQPVRGFAGVQKMLHDREPRPAPELDHDARV